MKIFLTSMGESGSDQRHHFYQLMTQKYLFLIPEELHYE